MAKVKFDRSKPHLNVGTMGHIDHGKTTLTAAITKVAGLSGLGDFRAYDQISASPSLFTPLHKNRSQSQPLSPQWDLNP